MWLLNGGVAIEVVGAALGVHNRCTDLVGAVGELYVGLRLLAVDIPSDGRGGELEVFHPQVQEVIFALGAIHLQCRARRDHVAESLKGELIGGLTLVVGIDGSAILGGRLEGVEIDVLVGGYILVGATVCIILEDNELALVSEASQSMRASY